ncbi:MAG: hypothetical protein QNJ40_20975 [Xanthomonadales bacterium]|nr:hypothetical protein [Xanthomonadales bacterium]
MRIRKLPLSAAVVAAMFAAPALADQCDYSKDLGFDLDASGLSQLMLDVGAGKLEVSGQAGADTVSVVATACASSQKILDQLELDQRRKGDTLVLETGEVKSSGWSLTGKSYHRIDLDIVVPASMALEIDDGSGSMVVTGVASVVVDDGSGGMEIRDIGGDVTVDDGSGGITIEGVAGSVRVDDGSGGMEISGVEQSVYIDEDGSGDIKISDVIADVEIDEDGSGGIRVLDVGGNVLVADDSSGGIKVTNVSGDFMVERDSNGSIDYSNIDGSVSIPRDKERKRRM